MSAQQQKSGGMKARLSLALLAMTLPSAAYAQQPADPPAPARPSSQRGPFAVVGDLTIPEPRGASQQLIPAVHAAYLASAAGFNPDGAIRRGVYPYYGADASIMYYFEGPNGGLSELLAIEQRGFGTPEQVVRGYQQRPFLSYFIQKLGWRDVMQEHLLSNAVGPAILWEIEAMGGRNVVVTYLDGSGQAVAAGVAGQAGANQVVRIEFDWRGQRRAILFVQADVSNVAGYPPVVSDFFQQGVDVIISKQIIYTGQHPESFQFLLQFLDGQHGIVLTDSLALADQVEGLSPDTQRPLLTYGEWWDAVGLWDASLRVGDPVQREGRGAGPGGLAPGLIDGVRGAGANAGVFAVFLLLKDHQLPSPGGLARVGVYSLVSEGAEGWLIARGVRGSRLFSRAGGLFLIFTVAEQGLAYLQDGETPGLITPDEGRNLGAWASAAAGANLATLPLKGLYLLAGPAWPVVALWELFIQDEISQRLQPILKELWDDPGAFLRDPLGYIGRIITAVVEGWVAGTGNFIRAVLEVADSVLRAVKERLEEEDGDDRPPFPPGGGLMLDAAVAFTAASTEAQSSDSDVSLAWVTPATSVGPIAADPEVGALLGAVREGYSWLAVNPAEFDLGPLEGLAALLSGGPETLLLQVPGDPLQTALGGMGDYEGAVLEIAKIGQ